MTHVKLISLAAAALLLVPSLVLGEELFGVGPAASDQAATRPATTRESVEERARRRNPPDVVDILEHVETADRWSAGTMTNIAVIADDPSRIQLGFRERQFPREGTWTGRSWNSAAKRMR